MSRGPIRLVPVLLLAVAGCLPDTTDSAMRAGDPAIDGILDIPIVLDAYAPDVPRVLQEAAEATDTTPPDNPLTDAGATLGRVLFWDTSLSADGTIACASCHLADAGFADDVPGSQGVAGTTGRKSMPLVNVGFYRPGRMFWDERAETLEAQVLMPFQDPVEMGLTLEALVDGVQAAPYYPTLFTTAFGDDTVTVDRIARALAQFVRSITTFDARWDAGVAATGDPIAPFPNFTAEENRGKDIFFGRHEPGQGPLCTGCHLPPLPGAGGPPGPGGPGPGTVNTGIFHMPGPRVNGLPDPDDQGIADVTGRPDGPRRLGLSPADQAALVAFLRTLTDLGPSQDVRFSDPFLAVDTDR